MDAFSASPESIRFSLTDADLGLIRGALPQLLGRWSLITESGDEGELYGRLLPPWGNSRHSAFLIEREDEVVILTDNLSALDRCVVKSFPNAMQAMHAVQSIVQDAEADRRANSSDLTADHETWLS